MNPLELFHKDGTTTGIWYCRECRTVHRTQPAADACCRPMLCPCGAEASKYRTVCQPCLNRLDEERERARFEAAGKVTKWDGPVFRGDSFYWSVDDIDDPPSYVWTAVGEPFVCVDLDGILETIAVEAYEDFEPIRELNGLPELKCAIDRFEEANKNLLVYRPNHKLALVLNA